MFTSSEKLKTINCNQTIFYKSELIFRLEMGDPAVKAFMRKCFPSEPVEVPLLRTVGDGDCFLRSILQDVYINGYVTGNEAHIKSIFSTFDLDSMPVSATQESAQPFLRTLRCALIDKAKLFFHNKQILRLESEIEWEGAKSDYKDPMFDYLISFTSHIVQRHLLIFDEESTKIIVQSGNAFDEEGTKNVVNNTPILLARISLGNHGGYHYQILKSKNSQYWRSYVCSELQIPNKCENIQEC